ncbi:MAG: RagB/SusD family nutrient uptake outer membrane protein [Porphyromonas sp.]|nr:RagB/SusD family nutrient uptake outer membrane protein [Porphyromonas sp.]
MYNRLTKYIITVLLALVTTSCDNFLSIEPADQLTSNAFWRDARDANAGVAAAYSQLEYSIDTWGFAEVKWPVEAYREDIVLLGADATNYPNWVELSTFTYTNGNSQVLEYWNNNYIGISFCNQILEKVPNIPAEKITEQERNQYIAEAHFLRAYYHLKLLLNFEEIIIRDTYIVNQDQLEKGNSTREETWNFIISDLKAATSLPASYDAENVGRATSGAANAYLGLCYLTMAYEQSNKKAEHLQQAVTHLDKVVGYTLEPNFISMFTGDNKNCKESIFELQFSMTTANGANYRTQFHKWMAASELGGWDEILPSEILLNAYKKEGKIATTGLYDSRFYETIFFNDPYYNDGSGKIFGKDYNDLFDREKPVFRKFLPNTAEGMKQNYSAINIPLMRYANVLLMKAEALNELGRTADAIPLINQVRAVHGDMPPITGTTQDAVRLQIEHERMIEFPLENWRWYDLRRWGKLESAMRAANRSNFSLAKHAFYPIPLVEVNSNKALTNN